MAKGRQKKWSYGFLKNRGWTLNLIRSLLPEENRTPDGMRYWFRRDVMAAEQSPVFREHLESAKIRRDDSGLVIKGTQDTASDLAEAWEAAEKDDSLTWVLAERWHTGIVNLLRKQSGNRKQLRTVQIRSYLNEFLALEDRCDSALVPTVLKHFFRAAPWLERNRNDAQSLRLCSRYPRVLYSVAAQAAADFTAGQTEERLRELLSAKGFPVEQLIHEGLGRVWSVWYVPRAVRTSLSLLVALNPRDEYPEARAMRRHFILHLGGTNTGKTYAGLRRLSETKTGVYLGPLRLLALEAQETLLDAGVDCGLSTGEESDLRDTDTHIAATAEKLELKRRFDAAVIDECQMITDRQRGYAWTRAILGVLSPEVHLCAAPYAKDLLLRLIAECGDTAEVVVHERKTPLRCMNKVVDYRHMEPGDALITFSKLGVLSVAEDLRQAGMEPAIIYGALPYATRRRQMEGFLEGRMRYVVATDAIGMGLNLPIRRVIFMETRKFDGVETRPLKPEEIQQIAGRAGRYGMYEEGWAGATENLAAIRAGLDAVVPPIQYAVAGFSELVLDVDFDLLEVLTVWSQMPSPPPYVKLDVSRYLNIITRLREKGFLLSKEEELRAANIPFDETEEELRELFFEFLRLWQAGEPLEQPALPEEGQATLPQLELYYRKLDLYFSFSKAFACVIDEDRLYDTREQVAEEINEILLHRLRNNIRFCARCGAALPLHHRGRICDACYIRDYTGKGRRGH